MKPGREFSSESVPPAGRALDALVAEKVMGAKPVKTVWGKEKQYSCWSLGEPDWYDDQGASELFNPLPSYSTDIAAAWEVVAALQATRHVHISDTDDGSRWVCEFIYGGPNALAEGSTLPEAICLAALKAVGRDV